MKTLNPRWGRIQELFNQAADMPLSERAAFLNAACNGDVVLRKELDDLLAADAGPPSDVQSGIRASLLTQAVSMAIDKTTRDRRSELIGSIVGSYRLTAVLGHGGAGTVYLGERADRQYSAQVAIKVVENALLHEEVTKRFQAERQILANLNHPHIARLLDAGETRTGQPFLVMEYVHGEPIDRYCDSRNLSINERLQLFVKVCAAVQYAHQNLIVHRDLKPGNILVTADGTPKLLDFGIAKLMDASAKTAAELALTRVNDRVLTPEYASPEQILGQNVTTTSDVYALGIVLYELLTGSRPYQVNAVSQLELERSICIMDPARPSVMIDKLGKQADAAPFDVKAIAASRGVSVKRLQHELIGDIDAIVMRALRKEPERRYSSVEQLVDDVKRQLDQQPVLARQGNWLYYTKRFVRRHALGVGMSSAALMALIAFSVVVSVQKRSIAEQRDLAKQESTRAESVSNFMLEVFTASDPFEAQGKQVTAKDLLDKAGQRISGDLNQQPEVRARLLEAIGRAYQRQGQYDTAVKYLDDSLLLQHKLPPGTQNDLANTLSYLGSALRDHGDYLAAEENFQKAMRVLESRNEQQSPKYSQLLSDMGRLKLSSSDPIAAASYLEQSLNLQRKIYGNTHPETAGTLLSLAHVMVWQNKNAQAIEAAREAVAIYHATLPENHPDRVIGDMSLGEMLLKQGNLDEAAGLVAHALVVQRLLYGSDNVVVAATLDTLAMIQQSRQQWDVAEISAKEALAITEKALGATNVNTAYYYSALADLYIKRKKYRDAEQPARAALNIYQATATAGNQYLASAEYLLAEVLVNTNRSKEAEPLLRANIDRWQQATAPAWRSARSSNLLGVALMNLHQATEGKQLLQQSYATLAAPDSGAYPEAVAIARERMRSFGL
jgi:serine/threonine protein kinase